MPNMNDKLVDYLQSIMCPSSAMKDWQIIEIQNAYNTLYKRIINNGNLNLPMLCRDILDAGGKICHFESNTEWECTVNPPCEETSARILEIIKKLNPSDG